MTSSNQKKWHSLGDFLKAKEEREKEAQRNEAKPLPAQPSQAEPLKAPPPTPVTPVTGVVEEAAPRRDFTRVANSIVRDAIPSGIFTGKCKQLYDYLYLQTRGAIVPVRSARIPTERVMKGAGMTRHTYRAHIHRLISFGLVEVEEKPGEHGGNVYTVYLPEENENRTDRGHRGDRGHTGEKVPVVQGSEVHPCDRGLNSDASTGYGEPNTLIKTNTDDDDEAFADFVARLREISKEVSGKYPGASDRARWEELANVLAAELKIAAARTSVSSAPAFLAEHLRRRLWKVDKRQARAEGTELPDETLKSATGLDAARCPDCMGSGWWYPEGSERGVKKCSHANLKPSQQ
jgi:hypothetical protein